MPALLRFLVRPEAPTYIFDISPQQRFLGGLILHRMSVHAPAPMFMDATILYGAFLVQNNYGEMVDGSMASMRPDELPLFFLSTQAGCALLTELAGSPTPPDARARVALRLRRTNAITEVVSLLRYPEAKYDPLFKLKMECVTAAALLLAAVAPRPEPDTLPESACELLTSELEASAACAAPLVDYVHTASTPLLRIVQCCDNRSAMAAACLALARFGATGESALELLEQGELFTGRTLD
jgi:hypothetical protein